MTSMRNVERWLVVAGASGLLLMVLAACVVTPPEPTETPTAPASPTPTPPAAALSCDDLVTSDDVAVALTGADGVPPEIVAAVRPTADLDDYITEAAGGLSCSWRAGDASTKALGSSKGENWAYLTVDVLPGGAAGWRAWAVDGGEHEELTTFAGVDAVASCGDPGCGVYTAVGDAAVTLELRAAGWGIGQSRFEGVEPPVVRQMESATRSVLEAVGTATPERLAWPRLDTSGGGECDGALDAAGIAAALGVEELTWERMTMVRPGTAADVVGLYSCQVAGLELPFTMITVGRGLAPVLDAIATTADASAALEPVALAGAVAGERALLACEEGESTYCSLLFSIGSTAYQVRSKSGEVVAIAEAMIAQAR